MTNPIMQDPKQRLRLLRNLQAMSGAAILTLLCIFLMAFGNFRASWPEFVKLAATVWAINFCFPLLFITGLNKRFADPSLTMIQTLWAAIVIVGSLYFVNQMRMVILLFSILTMVFGAFRLRPIQFFYLTTCLVVGYGVVIFALRHNYPWFINLQTEVIQWATYSVVVGACAYLGSMQSKLRRTVRQQNQLLRDSVKEARKLAITDPLTGLYNRRHVMEMIQYQKKLAERNGTEFVVIYADLDHFKKVNDRYGHGIGDQVLQRFAEIAGGSVRRIDFVSRFGGEEFVIVLVATSLEKAKTVAERLRSATEGEDMDDLAPGLGITVSLGVTAYRAGEEIDAMITRADQALYQAKQEGRNRIVYKDAA